MSLKPKVTKLPKKPTKPNQFTNKRETIKNIFSGYGRRSNISLTELKEIAKENNIDDDELVISSHNDLVIVKRHKQQIKNYKKKLATYKFELQKYQEKLIEYNRYISQELAE